MSATLQGFLPAGCTGPESAPEILILGSFPSATSLGTFHYYAHPGNHFWRLVSEVFGSLPPNAYRERLAMLDRHGIAIWDVIATCERDGSMDRDIRNETYNPVRDFLESHPSIRRIGLNGSAAASVFVRFSLRNASLPRTLPAGFRFPLVFPHGTLTVTRLPSSSPIPSREYRSANDKLPIWRRFLLGD